MRLVSGQTDLFQILIRYTVLCMLRMIGLVVMPTPHHQDIQDICQETKKLNESNLHCSIISETGSERCLEGDVTKSIQLVRAVLEALLSETRQIREELAFVEREVNNG